jgi:hypothetical protein
MHDFLEFDYTNHASERVRFKVQKETVRIAVTTSLAPTPYQQFDKWYYSENELPQSWPIGQVDPDDDEDGVKQRVVDDYIRRRAESVHANVQVGVRSS